jgi:hypothetical protein
VSDPSLEFLQRQNAELRKELEQFKIGGGGGDGTMGGMEVRVAKLESDVEYIKRDVADIKSDVRALRDSSAKIDKELGVLAERVFHLPRKDFIVKAVLATLAVIAALIVFQGNIQKLLHLG